MNIIRKRDLIQSVNKRWRHIYCNRGKWKEMGGLPKEEIYRQLTCLPDGADENQVIAIIGNSSWTQNICDECEQDVDVLIRLGQELTYETTPADVCLSCLREAVKLLDASLLAVGRVGCLLN